MSFIYRTQITHQDWDELTLALLKDKQILFELGFGLGGHYSPRYACWEVEVSCCIGPCLLHKWQNDFYGSQPTQDAKAWLLELAEAVAAELDRREPACLAAIKRTLDHRWRERDGL